MAIAEEFGGGGTTDFRFNQVIGEELAAAGNRWGPATASRLHNDITTPYFIEYLNDEQTQRWLPGVCLG